MQVGLNLISLSSERFCTETYSSPLYSTKGRHFFWKLNWTYYYMEEWVLTEKKNRWINVLHSKNLGLNVDKRDTVATVAIVKN